MTDPERPLSGDPPAPPARRGVIGPFSGRHLLTALGVVVATAVLLVVVTRPLGPGPGAGPPTMLPGATPYLVGSPTTGLQAGQLAPELEWLDADGATVSLTDLDGNATDRHLVIGQVVGVHLDERFIRDDGILDVAAMRPIARCGYTADYTVLDRLFQMERPR